MRLVLSCTITVGFLFGVMYLLVLVFDRNERAIMVGRRNEQKTTGYVIVEAIEHILIYGALAYLLENIHA